MVTACFVHCAGSSPIIVKAGAVHLPPSCCPPAALLPPAHAALQAVDKLVCMPCISTLFALRQCLSHTIFNHGTIRPPALLPFASRPCSQAVDKLVTTGMIGCIYQAILGSQLGTCAATNMLTPVPPTPAWPLHICALRQSRSPTVFNQGAGCPLSSFPPMLLLRLSTSL